MLLKSMDLKLWRGDEHEPWENVEARVIDAAEAVDCEEALFTDFKEIFEEREEDGDAVDTETINKWKDKSDAAFYIIKRIFSGKGKSIQHCQ